MADADPPIRTAPRERVWTLSQRRAMLALLCVMTLTLWVTFFRNRQYVPDPQPPQGPRAAELASRLDPNTADWQALAAIPNLGEKRAHDIVAYRERVRASKPGAIVFRSPNDFRAIRGIGPATVQSLRAYLIFPGEAPTSASRPTDDGDASR